MVRTLLRWGLVLLAFILVYNFFFGTDAEKDQSRKIFGQLKGVAGSAIELVKSEKQKFDAGKYDNVLSQLSGVYKGLREKAEFLDEKVLTQLSELEKRKQALQQEVDKIENEDAQPAPAPAPTKKGLKRSDDKAAELQASKAADLQRRKDELNRQLEALAKETQKLAEEAEKGTN